MKHDAAKKNRRDGKRMKNIILECSMNLSFQRNGNNFEYIFGAELLIFVPIARGGLPLSIKLS